jgi:hypothetical protein
VLTAEMASGKEQTAATVCTRVGGGEGEGLLGSKGIPAWRVWTEVLTAELTSGKEQTACAWVVKRGWS